MEKTTSESLESQTTSVVPRRPFPRLRNLGGCASKRRTVPDPLPVALDRAADEPEALPSVPDDEPEEPEGVELPGRDAEGAETAVDGDDAVAPVAVGAGLVTVGTLTVGVGLVTVGTLTVGVGLVTVGTLTVGTGTGTVGTLTVGRGTLETGSSANACAHPIASSADAPRIPRAPFTILSCLRRMVRAFPSSIPLSPVRGR
jgi:hypothetical protein